VKYAEPVPFLEHSREALEAAAARLPAQASSGTVRLIEYDPNAEKRVLAAALFAHSGSSFDHAQAAVEGMDRAGRSRLAQALLGGMQEFDTPPREMEHSTYVFEAVLDQGAYFELKRHRMMTQTPQRLSADLGFAVPRLMAEAGFEAQYRQAMQAAREVYGALADWNHHVAAYLVPNGFNRRVLMTLNLREAYHLCELRSAPNAHFSMRRIALHIAEQLAEVHPLLTQFMRLPQDADWRAIERETFDSL